MFRVYGVDPAGVCFRVPISIDSNYPAIAEYIARVAQKNLEYIYFVEENDIDKFLYGSHKYEVMDTPDTLRRALINARRSVSTDPYLLSQEIEDGTNALQRLINECDRIIAERKTT